MIKTDIEDILASIYSTEFIDKKATLYLQTLNVQNVKDINSKSNIPDILTLIFNGYPISIEELNWFGISDLDIDNLFAEVDYLKELQDSIGEIVWIRFIDNNNKYLILGVEK